MTYYTSVYLRCLPPKHVEEVMQVIHEGEGGNHAKDRSLAFKMPKQGYFLPYMSYNGKTSFQNCDKCQRYGDIIHRSPHELVNVP